MGTLLAGMFTTLDTWSKSIVGEAGGTPTTHTGDGMYYRNPGDEIIHRSLGACSPCRICLYCSLHRNRPAFVAKNVWSSNLAQVAVSRSPSTRTEFVATRS